MKLAIAFCALLVACINALPYRERDEQVCLSYDVSYINNFKNNI